MDLSVTWVDEKQKGTGMKRIIVVVVFVILTILRFFTACVDFQREEDPTVILKCAPTVQNVFYGSDKAIAEYSEKYEWYREEKYIEMIHLASIDLLPVYLFIADLWFVSAAALAVIGIFTAVKK